MDNKIYISGENGQEIAMDIAFTFKYPENEKEYVVVTDNNEDYYAFEYDDQGNLFEVEDAKILEVIQEMIDNLGGEDEDE